ncbi:hypothetical protein QBC39DRAFT_80833 [Podospora conica]|nr:hypothetical protein QBC39DRAFT_80833 [Schizothecium conicum]
MRCLIILRAAVATAAVVATDSPPSTALPHRPLRRGDLEHYVLADCTRQGSNFLKASQLAYFTGPVVGFPHAITNVTSDKHYAWAGSGEISIKTPDSVVFSVEIPSPVRDGQFAGSGQNGFSAFSCYAMFKKRLYTTEEGLVCDQVYDCDHITSPPVTSTIQSSSSSTPAASIKSSSADPSPAQPTGSSSTSNPTSSPPEATSAPDDSLSKAQKIGIGVGAGVPGLAIIITILIYLFPRTSEDEGLLSGRGYRFSHKARNHTGNNHTYMGGNHTIINNHHNLQSGATISPTTYGVRGHMNNHHNHHNGEVRLRDLEDN